MTFDISTLPPASTCRLIDFDSAAIEEGPLGGPVLVVEGIAPCINMEVRLMPLMYVDCPDHWGIEVVGCLEGICLTSIKDYSVSLPLKGYIGKKGIEVIGATKKKTIEVEGGCR